MDVGHLTLGYRGNWHKRAGACQVSQENADKIIRQMLITLQSPKFSKSHQVSPDKMADTGL